MDMAFKRVRSGRYTNEAGWVIKRAAVSGWWAVVSPSGERWARTFKRIWQAKKAIAETLEEG